MLCSILNTNRSVVEQFEEGHTESNWVACPVDSDRRFGCQNVTYGRLSVFGSGSNFEGRGDYPSSIGNLARTAEPVCHRIAEVWPSRSNVSAVLSPVPGGTNYNVFVFEDSVVNASDPNDVLLVSPILSATNTESVEILLLQTIYFVPGAHEIDRMDIVVPPEVVTPHFLLTWGNYQTNLSINIEPKFVRQLQSKSALIGDTVTLSAVAYHTTGYRWQFNGTNVVDDNHFNGATTSTLTISNAQPADAGSYTVVADHPNTPVSSAEAILSIFKPIQMSLVQNQPGGNLLLKVGRLDESAIDSDEATHLVFHSTTDLSIGATNWETVAGSGSIVNGVYQVALPNSSEAGRFWRAELEP